MRAERQYFFYPFGKNAVRGVLIGRRHWYSAADIYKAFGMSTSKGLTRRLASYEVWRCYFGRKKMLLVSSSGLTGIFPKREHRDARAAIAELLMMHPDQPGLCPLISHPICIEMNAA